MTRETKLGLLIGAGIILLIGIIVSDHLSASKRTPTLTQFGPEAAGTIAGDSASPLAPQPADASSTRTSTPTGQAPPAAPAGGDPAPARGADGRPLPPLEALRTPRDPLPLFDPPAEVGGPGTPGSRLTMRELTPGGLHGPGTLDRGLTPTDPLRRDPLTPPTPLERMTGPRDPNSVVHYVQRGETLAAIAKKYYNNASQWQLIANANKSAIGPNGLVREGVRLVIPPKPATPAGNTPGAIARLDTSGRTPAPAGKTIKVEAGDTLSQLASKHLGATRHWQELLKANSDKLKRAEDLRPGMVLKLPTVSATPATSGRLAVGPTTRPSDLSLPLARHPAGGKTYTVQAGDTLGGIAKKTMGHSAKWQDLLAANRSVVSKPEALRPGMVLAIPTGGAPTTAGRTGTHDTTPSGPGTPRGPSSPETPLIPTGPELPGIPGVRPGGTAHADIPDSTLIPITADPLDLGGAPTIAAR